MDMTFSMVDVDKETWQRQTIEVSHTDLEYLPDVLEVFLRFLQACGYTYVNQIQAVCDSGEVKSTVR